MNGNLPLVFFGGVAAIALVTWLVSLYRRVRGRGGMAGVLVGADIERTVDRVEVHASGMSSGEMRVHRFADPPADREVGLELILRTAASYNAMTAGISREQALELAAMLRRGIGETVDRPQTRRSVRDGPV
jgi:hypothetical protein